MAAEDWDGAYIETPPWDIGRPQPEFVKLSQAGEIQGSVLDVGCGTGENALYLAEQGHEVWGVDFSSLAIGKAKAKATKRGLRVHFLQYDALKLQAMKRSFDSAIDSGLFHVFTDTERGLFTESIHSVLRPGGTYFMMCFSEKEPADWGGPRRVTQREIRETFKKGWRVNYIRGARFATNMHDEDGGVAWLVSVTRL